MFRLAEDAFRGSNRDVAPYSLIRRMAACAKTIMRILADSCEMGIAMPDLNEVMSEMLLVARQHRASERMALTAGPGRRVNANVFGEQGAYVARARAMTCFTTNNGLFPRHVTRAGTGLSCASCGAAAAIHEGFMGEGPPFSQSMVEGGIGDPARAVHVRDTLFAAKYEQHVLP